MTDEEIEQMASAWDAQHKRYAASDWIDKPTLFAEWALQFFPRTGKMLDVGCGQGQDSRFFAARGYKVIGYDFSVEALEHAYAKTPDALLGQVMYVRADLSEELQIADDFLDVVYSHLAIHYFDAETTQKIFDEFLGVLKPGGILAVLVNSTHDAEIATGTKIEDDFYLIGGMKKRFFSPQTISRFASKFEIIVADDKGETYKDRAIGNTNLVRLIARKKA